MDLTKLVINGVILIAAIALVWLLRSLRRELRLMRPGEPLRPAGGVAARAAMERHADAIRLRAVSRRARRREFMIAVAYGAGLSGVGFAVGWWCGAWP